VATCTEDFEVIGLAVEGVIVYMVNSYWISGVIALNCATSLASPVFGLLSLEADFGPITRIVHCHNVVIDSKGFQLGLLAWCKLAISG